MTTTSAPDPKHVTDLQPISAVQANMSTMKFMEIASVLGVIGCNLGQSVMQSAAHVSALETGSSVAFAAFVATLPVHALLVNKKTKLEQQYIEAHGTKEHKAAYQEVLSEQPANLKKFALMYGASLAAVFAAFKLLPVVTNVDSGPGLLVTAGAVASLLVANIKGLYKVRENQFMRSKIVDDAYEQQDAKNPSPFKR